MPNSGITSELKLSLIAASIATPIIDDILERVDREINEKTKIIFVNHEFGYPYPKMNDLLKLGLPIIEDCCTCFFSQNKIRKIGKYGEFAIYSFSKIFPIESGGLIISNTKKKVKHINLDKEFSAYLENVISYNLKNKNLFHKQEAKL